MRLIRLVIICIALGFVTTGAVAWGLAAWLPQRGWNEHRFLAEKKTIGTVRVIISEFRRFGAVRRKWRLDDWAAMTLSSQSFDVIGTTTSWRGPLGVQARPEGVLWGRVPAIMLDHDGAPYEGLDHATGWPRLAAWYATTAHSPSQISGKYHIDGGIALPIGSSISTTLPAWKVHALPLRPIWTGLIGNTAFYSIVWLVMLWGASAARRWRRRRRGWCPRCAYDLAGLTQGQPCPECGMTPLA